MEVSELRAGIYEHYKGGFYQVIGLGEHTETSEHFIVYISLTPLRGPRIRVRPAHLFFDEVKWPDGKHAPRFRYVGFEIPGAPAAT